MPRFFPVVCAAILAIGCGGPSAAQWQESQQTIAKLKADLDAANTRHAEDERKYAEATKEMEGLKKKFDTVTDGYNTAVRATIERQQQVEALSRYHEANAAPPPADWRGWHQIWAGPPMGQPRCEVVISTTFEPSPALAQVRVRRAFIKRTLSSRAACPKEKDRVTTDQMDFDCGGRTISAIGGTMIDWNDNQVSTPDLSDVATPMQVFPDTYGEAEWKYVCGQP
jgi:hypothetical protein